MPGPMAQAVILGGRGRRIRNLKIPWARVFQAGLDNSDYHQKITNK